MSKKLNHPSANFDYAATVVRTNDVSQQPVVSSRGRQNLREVHQQEAWKNQLPAYRYKTQTGKKMDLPKRDDSVIGGYTGTGQLGVSVAKRYMEAKAAQDAKREEERKKRNAQLNPFDGLFDD